MGEIATPRGTASRFKGFSLSLVGLVFASQISSLVGGVDI